MLLSQKIRVPQAVATLKHWVGYGLENLGGVRREAFDANLTAFDLAASYLPPFEAAIKQGGARGVMCAVGVRPPTGW